MDLEICSPPMWQSIISWSAILINGTLAIYNMRVAVRNLKAHRVSMRLKYPKDVYDAHFAENKRTWYSWAGKTWFSHHYNKWKMSKFKDGLVDGGFLVPESVAKQIYRNMKNKNGGS